MAGEREQVESVKLRLESQERGSHAKKINRKSILGRANSYYKGTMHRKEVGKFKKKKASHNVWSINGERKKVQGKDREETRAKPGKKSAFNSKCDRKFTTLAKLLTVSGTQFPHLQNEDHESLPHKVVLRFKL